MLPLLAASMLLSLSMIARSEAIIGMTSSLVMRLTSSMARTFKRVGHGEEQLVVQARDGHDLVVVGDVAREQCPPAPAGCRGGRD